MIFSCVTIIVLKKTVVLFCTFLPTIRSMPRLLLFSFVFLFFTEVSAQVDTTKNKILNTRLSKRVMKSISRNPGSDTDITVKSEDVFMPYNGKIIRRIIIRQIGFEQSIYDTTRVLKHAIIKIANALHSNTREQVIRDNLFIRSGQPLNPFKVADNERYLRDLDFILDSKISVHGIKGNPDSVDLEIRTRDLFSLGITGEIGGLDKYEVGIYDANLFGMGQRLQTDVEVDADRTPFTAFDWFYRKSSVSGSLINASFGYSQLNNGRRLGEEYEHAYFIRLDRPLVSPYSRLAGGLELSKNWSKNAYLSDTSIFRKYRYDIQDVWSGYNLGVENRTKNRNRYFAAVRYFRQHYSQQPIQEFDRARSKYNDQSFALGSFTFYNQNFYKTRYVYGFGRTEDVPYGQTLTLTSGWTKELNQKRMYVGASAIKSIVHKRGNFYEAEVGYGSFFNAGKTEDATLFFNASFFSKLWMPKKLKLRQSISVGYAKVFNPRIRELLTLNNELRGFSPDSLYGAQRISLRAETTLFTKWKLTGFQFAPFLSLESAYLQEQAPSTLPKNFFFGTTGGLRIRNENLIFGTIELRAFYFPGAVDGVQTVSFKITTNVRLKYSGRFVKPPSFVEYN